MNSLHFRMEYAEDGTGELFLTVKFQDFSGASSCYVDLESLNDAAKKFALYPVPSDRSAMIEGGYFTQDMKGLAQTHLHVSAFPADALGKVGLHVSLAVPIDAGISIYKASLDCEFSVSYEQLNDLSQGLIALAERHSDEYSLHL
ncbi:hypothetical protein [Variovorax sp. W2I14]|uniref:hypothetical protein n=1 Tax=Variovorax sp. W2I14 TaxID=3042290 RepID=UPI003D243E59